jgi:DNA-binding MarR family transcriptional regulator
MDSYTDTSPDPNRDLLLLEQIENDPDVNQATLAAQLNVAVGTVNWHLKRLVAKGYVKVKRLQRRKLRYIITPEGIAFRARLTINYIDNSMRLYRRVRSQVLEQIETLQKTGHTKVYILGDGDIADICRLTCIEQGINAIQTESNQKEDSPDGHIPFLEIHGTKVHLGMAKAEK